jgi:hydroxymethylpyrimidine/phosphomethylpyrimidine kinase
MLFRLVAADLRTVLKKNIITFIAIAAVTVANLVYAYGLSSVYGVRTDTLGIILRSCLPDLLRLSLGPGSCLCLR